MRGSPLLLLLLLTGCSSPDPAVGDYVATVSLTPSQEKDSNAQAAKKFAQTMKLSVGEDYRYSMNMEEGFQIAGSWIKTGDEYVLTPQTANGRTLNDLADNMKAANFPKAKVDVVYALFEQDRLKLSRDGKKLTCTVPAHTKVATYVFTKKG